MLAHQPKTIGRLVAQLRRIRNVQASQAPAIQFTRHQTLIELIKVETKLDNNSSQVNTLNIRHMWSGWDLKEQDELVAGRATSSL